VTGEETNETNTEIVEDNSGKKRKKRTRKKPLTMEEMMERPARKQIETIEPFEKPQTGLYNIWYSRYCDYSSWRDRREAKLAGTRNKVDVDKDTGYTKAKKGGPICLFFSRGRCYSGEDCKFFHRIPIEDDNNRVSQMQDVFGRDRFRTDREDMGGVGSFMKDNKTLYVGGIKNTTGVEKILYKFFAKFGQITYLRVVQGRSIAFVQYKWRVSAEFAKEAMSDQSLDGTETY